MFVLCSLVETVLPANDAHKHTSAVFTFGDESLKQSCVLVQRGRKMHAWATGTAVSTLSTWCHKHYNDNCRQQSGGRLMWIWILAKTTHSCVHTHPRPICKVAPAYGLQVSDLHVCLIGVLSELEASSWLLSYMEILFSGSAKTDRTWSHANRGKLQSTMFAIGPERRVFGQ